jgi:hypothetical protein
MSSSGLEKLRKRMALTAYFRDIFGVKDPEDTEAVKQYFNEIEHQKEGYGDEGRSGVFDLISFKSEDEKLPRDRLIQYDENVRNHTYKINERRSDPIQFKPFQLLACLMTEAYLDRLTTEREEFLQDLNRFVKEQNDNKGRIKYPEFENGDLDKLAFWMATGSGKTLLMHINYYQYIHYAEKSDDLPENIILVTPNEGLSKQHIEKMRDSSIPCHRFNAKTVELPGVGDNPVKVIEIHKLAEKKTGDGKSVDVKSFGHDNLVFVDEGHKGSGINQTWRTLRESLAEEGFTFEYSATFGQALTSSQVSVQEDYGKSILYDYSYPRFYQDGYGKDYQIVNLENEVNTELRDRYQLANLLIFYEQIHVFNQDPETVRNTYKIKFPLLVFIGHTVNADTQSDVSNTEDQTLSDVEKSLRFMTNVLRSKEGWVSEAINQILYKDSGVLTGDEGSTFGDNLEALRKTGLTGEEIYRDLLQEVFNIDSSSGLELVDIEDADGEVGLRAEGTDQYFGVINIGGDKVFLDRIEGEYENISVKSDQFKTSLFDTINEQDSNINVLMGSRKFIEGWDSWRVSTMGLMNFGRGRGSQVIQLFGRGVRLLGKDRSLKRTSALNADPPNHLQLLETLNVFGVRATYMEKFRDYLSDEGIDTEPREVVEVKTKTKDHFQDQGLLVVRPEVDTEFQKEVSFELEAEDSMAPEVDLTPSIEVESSRNGSVQEFEGKEPQTIPEQYLALLDWNEVYRKIWEHRKENRYQNLVCEKSTLREIILDEHYTLYCPDSMLRVEELDDIEQVQQVVMMILRSYVSNYYKDRQTKWEQKQMSFVSMDEELSKEDGNFFNHYTLEIKTSANDFLEELQDAVNGESIYSSPAGRPARIHFDRHLYLPLLAEESDVDEEDVSYSPPALNEGEKNLLRNVKQFFEAREGKEILASWEVYMLRNRSRGRGIGLLSDGKRFFPDFIMWLQNDDHQHIVFLEPHGMVAEGEPVGDHRVSAYDQINMYEKDLTEEADRDDISLHSYVISQTPLAKLQDLSDQAETKTDFREEGLYFQNEVEKIISDILSSDDTDIKKINS